MIIPNMFKKTKQRQIGETKLVKSKFGEYYNQYEWMGKPLNGWVNSGWVPKNVFFDCKQRELKHRHIVFANNVPCYYDKERLTFKPIDGSCALGIEVVDHISLDQPDYP